MNNKHDPFQLIWKSTYSINKETVDIILKELNDEIRYQSTVVLPRTTSLRKKSVLKDIDLLRKQRDNLVLKYDDQRFPRASGGLGGDPQSTDENYKETEKSRLQDLEYKIATLEEKKRKLEQRGLPHDDQLAEVENEIEELSSKLEHEKLGKSIKKSISKKELFKALYGRVWGSVGGLSPERLEKMTDKDLDEQISALEKIFD